MDILSIVSPMLVLEFLQRIYDTFQTYFEDVTEMVLKDNFVTVYTVSKYHYVMYQIHINYLVIRRNV
jgi:hypothetical protein